MEKEERQIMQNGGEVEDRRQGRRKTGGKERRCVKEKGRKGGFNEQEGRRGDKGKGDRG